MNRFRRWYLLIGTLMVGSILFIALFADQITIVSPYYFHTKSVLTSGRPPYPPSPIMLLGTDQVGRDVWSRIAFGARWSLLFAFLIMGARMAVALPMAILAAYGPRFSGWLVTKLHVYTSAVPSLLIYLLVLSAPGMREIGLLPSVVITVGLLTLIEWPRITVVLRGRLQELQQEAFVEGAVAAGATRSHIFRRHLLPHFWPTLLQVFTAEMGRGLLNIAQLGFFGIWVGGGLVDIIDYSSDNRPVFSLTTSVPEWGTLLANARLYLTGAPWIAVSAATAFFVGIAGFNLLSQGLEGINLSFPQMRERLTRSHKAVGSVLLLTALVGGELWYHQGPPWGQQQALAAVVEQQSDALSHRDIAAFTATLLPANKQLEERQRQWAERLLMGDPQVAVVDLQNVQVNGAEATGLWTVSVGYKDKPPVNFTRSARLVRQGGKWYDAGDAFTTLKGVYTDVSAYYDPTDPTLNGSLSRFRINFLSAVADHGYEQALTAFPGGRAAARPRFKMYATQQSFEMNIMGEVGSVDPHSLTIWQAKNGLIHVSPDFLKGYNKPNLQEALSYEYLTYFTGRLMRNGEPLVLLTGNLQLQTVSAQGYKVYVSQLAGQPLNDLAGLLAIKPEELNQARQGSYNVQSALLGSLLRQTLSEQQVLDLVPRTDRPMGHLLAEALQIDPQALGEKYVAYVHQRILADSAVAAYGASDRVPAALIQAVAGRAKLAVEADPRPFLMAATDDFRTEQTAWLSAWKAAGMKKYEATLLDIDQDGKRAFVLERIELADGNFAWGVAAQTWVQRGGAWLLSPSPSPLLPPKR